MRDYEELTLTFSKGYTTMNAEKIAFGGGKIRSRNQKRGRADARTQSEIRRATYATLKSYGVEDTTRKRQRNVVQ